MSFKEIRFPLNQSFGFRGGPGFKTNVVTQNSGQEQRNEVWSLERGSWVVGYDARLPEHFDPLLAFFRIVRGRAYGFRFRDWSDYHCVITDGVFAAVAGSTTVFQLYKKYAFEDELYYRMIQKPALAEGLVEKTALFKNGIQLTYGVGAGQVVFDESKGLVTFNTAPGGSALSWRGEFDVPCRFDQDQMQAEIINKNAQYGFIKGWSSVAVIEVRV